MNQLKLYLLLRLVLVVVPVISAVIPDQTKNDTLDISSLLHTFQVRILLNDKTSSNDKVLGMFHHSSKENMKVIL